MSISFVWDSNWETIPTDQIPRGDIRNHIGQIKIGTRERMEVEHEWGPNSLLDTGGHIPGGTGVLARGSVVPATNLRSGELCVVDTGGGDAQVYLYADIGTGLKWNLIGTIDHSLLTNRNVGDTHPLYLKRAGDDIQPNEFKMGGNILKKSTAYPDFSKSFGDLLLFTHSYGPHPTLGDLRAISDNSVVGSKVCQYYFNSDSGSIPNNTMYIPSYTTKMFFPEVTIKISGGSPNKGVRFMGGIQQYGNGFGIVNSSGGDVPFQIRGWVAVT